MELLNCRDLSFTYPGNSRAAINNISFSVQEGEFILLCGTTGSGKTTLLQLIKAELAPKGTLSGEIKADNIKIGFVLQRPEQQIVTDRVWHELAFGLENTGMSRCEMEGRIAEITAFFGLTAIFNKPVNELSGGEKQLLNLAAVMVMAPDILILDEPTSQLDPIAAEKFMDVLKKLNSELGQTIIITEHRLGDIIPLVDRIMVIEKGKLICDGPSEDVVKELVDSGLMAEAMPAAARIFSTGGPDKTQAVPLTVKAGRLYLEKLQKAVELKETETGDMAEAVTLGQRPQEKASADKRLLSGADERRMVPCLEMSGVYFRYRRDLPDVLSRFDLTVNQAELFFLLGSNGSGKSTFLSVAAGLEQAYAGKVSILGKKINKYHGNELYESGLAMLPQDVQTVFKESTVKAELGPDFVAEQLPYSLEPYMDMHPYDLSGGEQQLVALAKVLKKSPKLLLLDEPTKGLDALHKKHLGSILGSLKEKGVTVLVVSHDVEFAAVYADRCALMFDGRVQSIDTPDRFFADKRFYTTAAAKMSRGTCFSSVTTEGILRQITYITGGIR